MKTYKKYTIFQSYKVVALKLSLPCPFESQNSKGRGRHNFWATTLKPWKNEYFLRVFKSYYYHFFIFLLDSDLKKTLLSQTSIAWGVLVLGISNLCALSNSKSFFFKNQFFIFHIFLASLGFSHLTKNFVYYSTFL